MVLPVMPVSRPAGKCHRALTCENDENGEAMRVGLAAGPGRSAFLDIRPPYPPGDSPVQFGRVIWQAIPHGG